MNFIPVRINWPRTLVLFIPIILWVLIVWGLYAAGVAAGSNKVQAQWDKEKLAYITEISKLQGAIQIKESRHRQESQDISEQLRKTEATYEKAIVALAAERSQRLLVAQERAEVYKRLSEGGTDQCRSLAGYATELDRSLEQGRSLVKELGSTIEQRDGQLRLLGAQIVNDRKLLDGN